MRRHLPPQPALALSRREPADSAAHGFRLTLAERREGFIDPRGAS